MRDVILSSNDEGTGYLLVAACSLLKNYRGDEPLRINVLDGFGGLKEENRERIRSLVGSYPPASVRFISIDPIMAPVKEKIAGSGRWNAFVWSSALGPDLVPDSKGNMLYLDIDQLVVTDVSPLFEMDLGTNLLAAVYENHRQFCTRESVEWDTGVLPQEAERYFTTGPLVFNASRFRTEGIRQKIFDWFLAHRDIATRLDQDAFNAVCWDRVVPLPMAWGFHDRMVRKIAKVDASMPYAFGNEPVFCYDAALHPRIFHFLGRKKPWNPSHRPYRKVYHQYMREVGLEPPQDELFAIFHDMLTRFSLWRIRRRVEECRNQGDRGEKGVNG